MMTWLGNLKTLWKLMIGFALMGVTLSVLGLVAGQGLLSLRESLRIVYEDYTVAGTDLASVAGNLNRTRTNDFLALEAPTQQEFEKVMGRDAEITASVKQPLEAYTATVLRTSKTGKDEAKDLQKFREAYEAYVAADDRMYELLKQSWDAQTKPEMEALRAKARISAIRDLGPKMEETIVALNELIATVKEVAKDVNAEGRATAANALFTLAVGTVVAIVIGLVIGWLIARALSRSLAHVVTTAQRLGSGDFAARATVTTTDEVGQLAQAFNHMGMQIQEKVTKEAEQAAKMDQFMVEAQRVLANLAQGNLTDQMKNPCEGNLEQIKSSLNGTVSKLRMTLTAMRESAESVATGADQIIKGNEDLSQRTSQQAASLEETSSAMEEITSTVKQSADNAKQANQLAMAARDVANKGGAVTTKAVQAMAEINQSSKKISDIITVIDEIAFQTNLLALNAAVEAARAGEHGRGFAVVATEVRNLAQRSALAAKEIKGLIHESMARVEEGSDLVNRSGKTLEEIVASVKHVSDIIAEISAASQEQASGIDQVNMAVIQMDQTTQQNAALVEETTSASQSLTGQAKELMGMVAAFKISVSKEEKAEMPTVASARKATAEAIHAGSEATGTRKASLVKREATYNGKRDPSESENKIRFTNETSRETTHAAKEPVCIASGNGKDRRSSGDEFEEF